MSRDCRMGFLRFFPPLLLFLLFSCETCAAGAQAQAPDALRAKHVLVLHAFEANAPVFQETDRSLGRTLQAGGIPLLNQSFRSLDLRRNPDPEYRKLLVEYMRTLYRHTRFDLIITMYPEALGFVLNEGRAILPDVPILALYLPVGTELPKTDRRIIFHASQLDVLGTLEMALKLVPGAKRVYVVSGAHESNRQQEERARLAFRKWKDRLEFHHLSHLPLRETLTTLAGVPRGAIVLLFPYSNDITGASYMAPDLTGLVSRAAAAPVFGLLEVGLDHGIVGGSLFSFAAVGTNAGRLALDILQGGSASSNIASVLNVPAVPMFDWRQLKRWNLTPNALPPESRIINREYTFWERYRTEAITVLFAFVLQALLIVSLMISRAQRQQVDRKLADQLRFEKLLAELSARFVNVPADQIEEEIRGAQRRICETLDLDRSSLWQTNEAETGTLLLTHFHTPESTPPLSERTDAREAFPWSYREIMHGRTIVFSSLEALPSEAARDRESLRRVGTKADVIVPLVAEGAVLGALTFAVTRGEREWSDDVVRGFRIVAEVIASALARRRVDQALRASQARLTLAAASADARLWEVEADTKRVWMTAEGLAFFGLGPNEAIDFDRMAEFIHADDRDSWRQAVWQALESSQPMRAEFRVVLRDGAIRWFVAQGRPSMNTAGKSRRMLGVSIDITDRKQAEERLRTSEALGSGVLASLPGHLVILDRSGAILRASDTWLEFASGNGALDPTVLAIGGMLSPSRPAATENVDSLPQEIREGIDAVLTGAQTDFRRDYACQTPTGDRWASVTILPLQRPEGGAVIYRQDITSEQRSRLEVEQLRRDLTHVSRVTTMGEMAAALAHELNQPLTAVLSNAHAGERYLTQAPPPLGEIREILEDVVADARRAGDVIQRLRSLLRKDETRFLELDFNQVVREIAALVHTDAVLRNLEIDLDLASDLPVVHGDRVQLQQVLLNLVLNAMESVGPNGGERRILIRTLQADAAVRVAVRDEGVGIPAETLPRLFETFYTTKPSGMGMGLPISRSIVEAHGGRIWAENNPDRGATFSFTLPACPPDPAPEVAARPARNPDEGDVLL